MAITRLGGANAISGTIPVSVGGTGVTTAANLANTGNLVLLSSQTASSDASINFTSNINSTYKIYLFKFFDIHPSADANFTFQTSTDGGSNYNVSTTGGFSRTQLSTSDGTGLTINVDASMSSHNDTGYITLTRPITQSASNSATAGGELIIYNPSGTSFHKEFLCISQTYGNFTQHGYIGGKINSASAINAVSFKLSTGNIDAGTITMYGVKA